MAVVSPAIYTGVPIARFESKFFQGVYLSLKRNLLANASNILITDVGEGEDALLCFTDLARCCDSIGERSGEWFFPNGSLVQIAMQGGDFYRNRGPSVVRLNRRNRASAVSPTGLYCCEVPDTNLNEKIVCVNISKSSHLLFTILL